MRILRKSLSVLLLVPGLASAAPTALPDPWAFEAPVAVPSGSNTRGLAQGDVDGDGAPDLVAANFGSGTFIGQGTPATLLDPALGTLRVLSSAGAGLQSIASTVAGESPRGLAVFPDPASAAGRVVASLYDADVVKVFRWTDGALVEDQKVPAPDQPVGVSVGRLGPGGTRFVALAGYGASVVALYPIGEDGRLGERIDLPVPTGPTQPLVVDLDGDGLPEIVVPCLPADKVVVLSVPNASSPLSAYAVSQTLALPAGSAPSDVRAADLDGDGLSDLAAALFNVNSVAAFLQMPGGGFAQPVTAALSGSHPNGLAVGTLDPQGGAVVAAAVRDSNTVDLLRWESGSLRLVQTLRTGEDTDLSFGPVEVEFFDADGDGWTDLVSSHMRTGTVRVSRRVPGALPEPTATPAPVAAAQPLSDATTKVFPNPSTGPVRLRFTLEAPQNVAIQIFDLTGQQVWGVNLPASAVQAGANEIVWPAATLSGAPVASGTYLVRVAAGDRSVTRKVFIVK